MAKYIIFIVKLKFNFDFIQYQFIYVYKYNTYNIKKTGRNRFLTKCISFYCPKSGQTLNSSKRGLSAEIYILRINL